MRTIALLTSGLLALGAVGATIPKARVIQSVDSRMVNGGVEVRIDGDGALEWTPVRMNDPERLIVDFAGTRNATGDKAIEVNDPRLKRVRIAQFQRTPTQITRVVFDLGVPAMEPEITGDGRQLRVVFGGAARGPTAGAAVDQKTDLSAPPPPARTTRPDSPTRRLRHLLYPLSYTQADRALAVLKALGYATVEFSVTPGDSTYDQLYSPVTTAGRALPVVIKLIDAPKTSLMDRDPAAVPLSPQQSQLLAAQQGSGKRAAVPDIGGTYLHQATTGEPQEQLLIVYDADDREPMERLVATLRDDLDVPARQVVISALVLEINTDRARELGLQFSGGNGRAEGSFEQDSSGGQLPFSLAFNKAEAKTSFVFSAKLKALIEKGEAEILSNPSVLVLDGRQARIQIGQQVPVVNSTSTAAGITSSVEYFPIGIVLNLRPRINESGSEVTMQVETIVSAVAQSSDTNSSVFFAPTVDNRQVQTFVRIADNTPFIIGGLISSDAKSRRFGIPGLSRLPLIGGLFGGNSTRAAKREVVVVLTPHVMPQKDRSFSYVIPQDSDRFDSFGRTLFRNAYRVRSTDLYDLEFVYESEVLKNVIRTIEGKAAVDPSLKRTEPFAGLLQGRIPGEGILVRRMLWEIVKRSGYAAKIDPKRILIFQPSAADPESTDFEASFLDAKLAKVDLSQNAVLLTFPARSRGTAEHPFVQPKAEVRYQAITAADFESRLIAANTRRVDGQPETWSILLTDAYTGSTSPLDILRNVLVLKRVLALNESLPLTLAEFQVGRQIIFPSEEDIEQKVHVVDRDAARLFYESKQYYRAFEQEFNATTRLIMEELKRDR